MNKNNNKKIKKINFSYHSLINTQPLPQPFNFYKFIFFSPKPEVR